VERIILDLLPIPDENKQLMGEQLRKGIEGVLFLPCKVSRSMLVMFVSLSLSLSLSFSSLRAPINPSAICWNGCLRLLAFMAL
jgi:hypothetical protein